MKFSVATPTQAAVISPTPGTVCKRTMLAAQRKNPFPQIPIQINPLLLARSVGVRQW